MSFNREQCTTLHLEKKNLSHGYKISWLGSNILEKELGAVTDSKPKMSQYYETVVRRANAILDWG